MTQSLAYAGDATLRDSKSLTVGQFVEQYGDDRRYELIDGELRHLEPTGPHESVAGTLSGHLFAAILQTRQPWIVPKNCLIQPPAALATVLRPDVIVLDEGELAREPLWRKEPIVCNGSTIKFVAEVTSTNWQDDYARKVEEYALLGILEYWIVDFRGLGGMQFIGSPKQPTVTVNQWVEGHYVQTQFRLGERIKSPLFPELRLMLDDLMPR
jgi:Uma2 family endonuclease